MIIQKEKVTLASKVAHLALQALHPTARFAVVDVQGTQHIFRMVDATAEPCKVVDTFDNETRLWKSQFEHGEKLLAAT